MKNVQLSQYLASLNGNVILDNHLTDGLMEHSTNEDVTIMLIPIFAQST